MDKNSQLSRGFPQRRESPKGGNVEREAVRCVTGVSLPNSTSLLQFSTCRQPALPEPAVGALFVLNQRAEKSLSLTEGFYVRALVVYSFQCYSVRSLQGLLRDAGERGALSQGQKYLDAVSNKRNP